MGVGAGPRCTSAEAVTWLGVVVNLSLGAGKVAVGLVSGSHAIAADGLHSLSDLVTDFAVLWGIRVSRRPADHDHHYGHRRYATLVALFVGAVLAGAAAWIAYDAVASMLGHTFRVSPGLPLAAAVLSMAAKEALYRVTARTASKEKDQSLEANAWHHRTDAFSSLAVAAGLGAVVVFGPSAAFVDGVVAAALSLLLLWTAGRIMRRAAAELVDQAPNEVVMRAIRDTVGDTAGVRGFHACRARKMGDKVVVDVHIQVDPSLTVEQGHEIATAVERRVSSGVPADVQSVTVHVEPDGPPEG